MKRQSIIKCLESAWFEMQLQLDRLSRKECMHRVFYIGFRRLSAYYEIRQTYECDKCVNEAFRRHVRREYEDGDLSVNFMRIFIRTANAVDNHMSGRRVDIVINTHGEAVPAMRYPDEKHDLGSPWVSIAEDYCNWLICEGLGVRTAARKVTKATLLLGFCEVNGLKSLEQLTFQCLAEFLVLAVEKGEVIKALKHHITHFLEFASYKGCLLPEIMDSMFTLRLRSSRRILPSFSAPEINAMLA